MDMPVTGDAVRRFRSVWISDLHLGKAPADCRAFAESYSWRACAELFLANLHPIATATSALPAVGSKLK